MSHFLSILSSLRRAVLLCHSRSLSPFGAIVKEDGVLANGLVTADGINVTLYAQWRRASYDVCYSLSHVTSTNNVTTDRLNGSYSTILKPESRYEMESVSITMGRREIAIGPAVYEPIADAVTINNVDGDIIIRVTAALGTTPPATRHTISISITGGTASPSGTAYVNDGDDLAITFTPNNGYEFSSASVDNSPANLTRNSYTYTNIRDNHIISVVYVAGSVSSGGGGDGGTIRCPITVEDIGNDTATSDKDEAAESENVTITIDGEVIDITVADEGGNEIPITDNGDGSYTFDMLASGVTVTAEVEPFEEADPEDTGVSNWLNNADHIAYLSGYPDGSFRPSGNMTRIEVAQMF